MKSINFEFLRETNRELAELGGFAEQYVNTDPASALLKLRLFGENLVADFFDHYQIPREPRSTFLDFLRNSAFETTVPPVVLNKLHALRINGNIAAHGASEQLDTTLAQRLLREAFDLAKWFGLVVHASKAASDAQFALPVPPEAATEFAQRERAQALQKLADQEAQMQQLLAELETARAQVVTVEKTAEEKLALLTLTSQAVNVLSFNEAETRRFLIDEMLVQAGWNVAPDEKSTDEVGKEVEVKHQPTSSGIGYADYVLWNDDGKPLAVIEAKKTVYDPEKGRKQAQLYADGLEKEHGQRPVIFYTNGYEIHIWDDVKGEVPRVLHGFYTKESLLHCVWKRRERYTPLSDLGPKKEIVDRMYQIEAIKQICECFDGKRRKALMVLATGTGKTRVAIALCDLLVRAHWVKRILFLCDRRELRKQANKVFGEFMDDEPRTYVTAKTDKDRKKTIYLATYPAMMKCFQNFDAGFFDLVIADESHRSIYNRYRDLFLYFDALQVGLTATPVSKIQRNTFLMFDCEEGNPTAHYSYNEAISDSPPYLVPFHVTKHTTKFLRQGIRYADMTPEEQVQVEEQVEDPELVDYSQEAISQEVFNKDTDRKILRNLMDNGVRDATGSHAGKSIIFARNHEHAIALQELFEEMYPQYMQPKREFCAVIDNYIDRAEQLIDDFKGEGNNDNLHIAISVDMLDTGIDVPEVVNLVFAKPVKSYVKFWQMIGRGTRLCKNLFGPGKHKEYFRIFDHWGNFEYFGENPPEYEPSPQKSLLQQVFEARMALAEAAVESQDVPAFETAIELLEKDVNALPDETIAVREKWRQVKTAQQPGAIKQFDAAIKGLLRQEIAPLMQWRSLEGHEDAYRFDLLVARLEVARMKRTAQFDDFRGEVQEQVGQLPINLKQVAQKIEWVNKVKDSQFWDAATLGGLEEVRRELRGIMHCRQKPTILRPPALHLDVTDSGEESEQVAFKLEGLQLAAYRQRVEKVFNELFEEAPALRKIKEGRKPTEDELRDLTEKVLLRDPDLRVEDLLVHFPNKAQRLDLAIRQVIGLDGEAVNSHFTQFVQKYPGLSSHQIRFLELIKKHIANYGALELEKLYEAPFTQIHTEGVDGVFTSDDQVDDLINLIAQINSLAPQEIAESSEET